MPIVKIKQCLNCSSETTPINHEWIFDGLTLRELRDVKKVTGLGQEQFAAAGDDGDPEALAALLWILHKRNKTLIPFEDVDLDFNHFDMVLTPDEQKEYDAAEAAAKAVRNGRNPKKAKNGTSAKVD